MRLLLDTHILLWMLDDSPRLGRRGDFRVDVDTLIEACLAAEMRLLPFAPAHTVRVARLPRHHADPFDRPLVAQALVEPLTPLTQDAKLAPYGSVVRFA